MHACNTYTHVDLMILILLLYPIQCSQQTQHHSNNKTIHSKITGQGLRFLFLSFAFCRSCSPQAVVSKHSALKSFQIVFCVGCGSKSPIRLDLRVLFWFYFLGVALCRGSIEFFSENQLLILRNCIAPGNRKHSTENAFLILIRFPLRADRNNTPQVDIGKIHVNSSCHFFKI